MTLLIHTPTSYRQKRNTRHIQQESPSTPSSQPPNESSFSFEDAEDDIRNHRSTQREYWSELNHRRRPCCNRVSSWWQHSWRIASFCFVALSTVRWIHLPTCASRSTTAEMLRSLPSWIPLTGIPFIVNKLLMATVAYSNIIRLR